MGSTFIKKLGWFAKDNPFVALVALFITFVLLAAFVRWIT